MFLLGCIGSGGNSAPAPNNVTALAKDTRVVLTWDMSSGVVYWLFKAAGAGVTPANCSKISLCTTTIKVTTPESVWGLYNGIQYSFSINGRTSGGPGGAGSPSVEATPNIAGQLWEPANGVTAGTGELRGLAYGASGAKFVAAGLGGALYSGIVATVSSATTPARAMGSSYINWISLAANVPAAVSGTDFQAVHYDTSRSTFYSIGAGGVVISNAPASTTAWTGGAIATANGKTLYAMANNGAGFLVAVGAGGTIITSSDGSTWADHTFSFAPGAQKDLYGVTYGYDAGNATYRFVAVGAAGTVLWSTDGVTWTDVTAASATTADLKGVTIGGYDATTGYNVFTAVGASGTVITSLTGLSWTSQASTSNIPATSNLNSIAFYGTRRFMAVASDGNIYYSEYTVPATGMVWLAAKAVTTGTAPVAGAPLYAVATGALYDYAAVGAGGGNWYADRAGN
jgi:hypothetical protein